MRLAILSCERRRLDIDPDRLPGSELLVGMAGPATEVEDPAGAQQRGAQPILRSVPLEAGVEPALPGADPLAGDDGHRQRIWAMIPLMRMPARLALAAAALVVAAWFGLSFYQDSHTQRASALVGGAKQLTPGQ